MKRRHKRIAFILVGLAGLGIATYFVASAFRNNLVFFFSPTQVAAKEAPINRTFRVGGLVQDGTLQRDKDGLTVRFTVTDTVANVPVVYKGILPDLFKEGRGCVAQGRIGADGVFRPIKSWQNTMRTTCRLKRAKRSTRQSRRKRLLRPSLKINSPECGARCPINFSLSLTLNRTPANDDKLKFIGHSLSKTQ